MLLICPLPSTEGTAIKAINNLHTLFFVYFLLYPVSFVFCFLFSIRQVDSQFLRFNFPCVNRDNSISSCKNHYRDLPKMLLLIPLTFSSFPTASYLTITLLASEKVPSTLNPLSYLIRYHPCEDIHTILHFQYLRTC